MEIRLVVSEKVRWCVFCSPTIRQTVVWETYRLAYVEKNKKVALLQLSWYWLDMTAEVRRTLRICEV